MLNSLFICVFLELPFKMTSANQCLQFDPEAETISEFLERFSVQMGDALYKVRADELKQAAILLRALPVAMVTDLQRRISPMRLSEASFTVVRDNFLGSYSVKKSVVGASVQFFTCKQEASQTIEDYSKKLKFLASQCNFDQHITLDRLLRDVFVAGLNSTPVLSTVLQTADSMTFNEAIDKAKLVHQIRQDAVSIQLPSSIHIAEEVEGTSEVHKLKSSGRRSQRIVPSNYICARCGQKASHFVEKCFALSLQCRNCGKMGHLAKVCRARQTRRSVYEVQEDGNAIHTIRSHHAPLSSTQRTSVPTTQRTPVPSTQRSTSQLCTCEGVEAVAAGCSKTEFNNSFCSNTKVERDSNAYDVNDIDHFVILNTTITPVYRDPINIQCRVNNIPVDFEVDSGAAVSVILENIARKVNAQITSTSHRVLGYSGGQIDLVGEALLPISYNNVSVVHKFLIVTGDKNNLFGRDLFSRFHVHIVVNPQKLNAIRRSISVLDEFSSYFNDDFQSCVKEHVHLNVAPNAKPVYAKARQIPIRLKDKVRSELDRLTSEGILTRVYSATWASPIVTIFKQDGSLRLCADFSSTVNKHLLPINTPLITIDEAITSVGSAKVFSKLDLSQAFLQLPVLSSIRKYLVINTPEGLFQFNYLPFGLTASPGIFQAFISKVLANIPGVLCYQDDILLMSSDVESHNKILKEVLSRLKDAGLKLNVNKCNFFVEQVEYLGYVFNEKGVHPKPGKISAIIDAPVPKDVKQVQAFIGLCNFYSRFISNFAALMSPLYALLKKIARFCWSDECQFAFDTVKNVFAEGHILQHFNVNYETCLETDASSYGVGAVLLQRASKDAPWLPIQFASRTLNAAEKNYSQLERVKA